MASARLAAGSVLASLACACDKQTYKLTPVAGIPPWPPDFEPQGQGCFSDHAENKGIK